MAEKLEIIIKGCVKGKPASQQALYERFSAAMYGLCLQYASSEEDARDIMQDAFVKVFRKIDQVKNPAAFPGWIRRVMINTALEKYRSQVSLQTLEEGRQELDEGAEDGVFENLTCQELVELIQGLSPRYRMVFNLYAIEGYSHQEISEMMGISVGTSKSNLSRARSILQDKVRSIYGSMMAR